MVSVVLAIIVALAWGLIDTYIRAIPTVGSRGPVGPADPVDDALPGRAVSGVSGPSSVSGIESRRETDDGVDTGHTGNDATQAPSGVPFDSDACHGCARACTFKAFRKSFSGGPSTADLVHWQAERRFRAEHGFASDLPAGESDAVCGPLRESHAGIDVDFDPIKVARYQGESIRREWFATCEACVDHVRTCEADGRDPFPSCVPSADVPSTVECPF